MPETPSVLVGTQVGIEATPGGAVPASSRLLCTQIDPTGVVPTEKRRSSGKASAVIQRLRRYTYAEVLGILAFPDLAYLLPSLLCREQIALVPGSTQTYRWTFRPQVIGAEALRGMTVQSGNADTGVEQFAYGTLTDLAINVTPDHADIVGRMVGRDLTTGMAPSTCSPLVAVPIDPWRCNVYVGNDTGSLVQLSRCVEFNLRIQNLMAGLQVLDDVQPSFGAVVDASKSLLRALIMVEYDSVAAAMMPDLRSKATKMLRFVATGDLIEPGYSYRLQITMPFEYVSRAARGGDAELLEYVVEARRDAAFGAAIEVLIDLPLSSLPAMLPLPGALTLTATSNWREVDLSWTTSTDAASYVVTRALVSGGPYSTVTTTTATSYSDTGLADSTTYYYRVQAQNGTGSTNSNEASGRSIGLGAYFRSGDWVGTTSVTPWNNAVSASQPLTQLSAFYAVPYQDSGTLNGRLFLDFDPSLGASGSALSWLQPAMNMGTSNWAIWIVAKLNDLRGVSQNPIVISGGGSTELYFDLDGTVRRLGTSTPLGIALTPGQWAFIKLATNRAGDPTPDHLTVNNTTVSGANAGTIPDGTWRLGLNVRGPTSGKISVAEFAVGVALSLADEAYVDNMIRTRFGL